VRARTTAAATLVVAVALVLGAVILVLLVRGSLRDGVEKAAEARATALADELERGILPTPVLEEPDEPAELDDPEGLVWQILAEDGGVVRSSQPLAAPLPDEDGNAVRLRGADHRYIVVTEDADSGKQDYVVVVAASLEDVDDSTAALLPPLAVGVPLVLLLVAGTTWLVATRALAPVERIRREVEGITADRLDRRVPEPANRDEIGRLARTMNQMLGRLEHSRDRVQQFVSDASHELRSPLAAVRQTAEVARAHPGALPEGELADAVIEESARMQRLVDQMLLLTRADEGVVTGARQDVDVDDLVLAEARRAARSGLSVDTSGVGPGRVRGDGAALTQVVRNLVDNAARHATRALVVGVRTDDTGVHLVVEDDGPGVPEADRQRIFDRFVRLDEARARDAGGSGLGLAIVREIVTAHGGEVAVSTAPGGGARFAVLLPAART
jgi:signal transduction histidine kinase